MTDQQMLDGMAKALAKAGYTITAPSGKSITPPSPPQWFLEFERTLPLNFSQTMVGDLIADLTGVHRADVGQFVRNGLIELRFDPWFTPLMAVGVRMRTRVAATPFTAGKYSTDIMRDYQTACEAAKRQNQTINAYSPNTVIGTL